MIWWSHAICPERDVVRRVVALLAAASVAVTAMASHHNSDADGGFVYTKRIVVSPRQSTDHLVAYVHVGAQGIPKSEVGYAGIEDGHWDAELFCPQPVAPYEDDDWAHERLNFDASVRFAVAVPTVHVEGLEEVTYQCWVYVVARGPRHDRSDRDTRRYMPLSVEVVYRSRAATATRGRDDEKAWDEDD